MNLYTTKGLFLTFILMITSVCAIHAQQINFTYDASGNQILRESSYRNRGGNTERDSVSTDRMWSHEVTATPNPTDGPLRVIVSNLHDGEECVLALFDSAGRRLLSRQVTNEVNFLDLSSYTDGYYILRCTMNDENESIKIIKE